MSLCCPNCFNDKFLKNHLRENGGPGNCDFCGKRSRYCIDPEELASLFRPVIDLYSIVEDFMPLYDLKEWDGEFVWEKLNHDWEIFDLDYKQQEELLRTMFPCTDPKEGDEPFLHSHVEREGEYWGTDDEKNEKIENRWEAFCREIKFENRFFIRDKFEIERFEALLSSQTEYLNKLKFYRARNEKCKKLKPSEMGKPPLEKSKHGRANPKGIPYLYLASDPQTAVAEIRPEVHDKITVGTFKINKPLNIINLQNPVLGSPFQYGDDLEYILVHFPFLRKLGTEISKPIDPEASELEYLPLQYLCEFIKSKGYDGVKYGSSVGEGYNLAVFNDDKANCTETKLYAIDFSLKLHKPARRKYS
jgi:hypothetical protein